MNTPEVIWLDEVSGSAPELLGNKGDRLAALHRAGFRSPSGFFVTTAALRLHLEANGLTPCDDPGRYCAAVAGGEFPRGLEMAIGAACRRLGADAVAVRSSALVEDLPAASSAGQQDTFLDVRGTAGVLAALRRCWLSLWSDRAVAYRRDHPEASSQPLMAVAVQAMVRCDVSGVAFSVDPLGGNDLVIEAAPGPGGAVGGTSEVEHHTVDRAHGIGGTIQSRLLSADEIRRVYAATLALEDLFRQPQDVEWGIAAGELWIFQSRPITVAPHSFFTDQILGDKDLWTSGFLNERFARPVSPLGWTLIRRLLEPLAFREPLHFLGCPLPEGLRITKLRRGHPFVNVRVFQILYKPFPDWLLPEDAVRYFPGGNTQLRREADYPCCKLDPRLLRAVVWNSLKDVRNSSPFHNYRLWLDFVPDFEKKMRALPALADLNNAWTTFQKVEAISARLLSIHRWSLTHADLFYSLLRQLLKRWLGMERAGRLAAQLTTGSPNKSLEMNRVLQSLRTEADWQTFMDAYGHRSFSLDIQEPSFAEEPEQIWALAGAGSSPLNRAAQPSVRETALQEVRHALRSQRWGRSKLLLHRAVLIYAQRYMTLREDQRFYWQKALAFQRGLALWVGRQFTSKGWLPHPEDVFFVTVEEIEAAVHGKVPAADEVARRKAEFSKLQQQWERSRGLSYPEFLRGDEPLSREQAGPAGLLQGTPVSPGFVRGPARLILSPGEFDSIAPGDILVTRAADPGWTPVFSRIGGLVLEVGGQLSHGAVVAREYGLPAVVGIPGVMQQLKDGQEILVDGLAGTVTIL